MTSSYSTVLAQAHDPFCFFVLRKMGENKRTLMKVMIKNLTYGGVKHQSRCSIVVSIPACHQGDPGSIPGNDVFSIFIIN